jgi:hypothetical protein
MNIKIPTIEEFESHDGLHYKNLWREVGDHWFCPSCKRSKYQIMRWAKRFPNSPKAFMGWVAPLHKHHDHSAPYMSTNGRFPMTIICDQCNSSDGTAKRKLKLPKNFSFSPEQIGCFVKATPHGKHKIDYEMAMAIYESINI